MPNNAIDMSSEMHIVQGLRQFNINFTLRGSGRADPIR